MISTTSTKKIYFCVFLWNISWAVYLTNLNNILLNCVNYTYIYNGPLVKLLYFSNNFVKICKIYLVFTTYNQ